MEVNLNELVERSLAIRKRYHELEMQSNEKEWTLEQDALAYLTDAGIIGRDIMSFEKTWHKANSQEELEHKLGENIWWLIILAERTGLDINVAVEKFLTKTEKLIGVK